LGDNHRKLLRKVTPDPLFRFPKSSFGRHNFRPSDEMSIKLDLGDNHRKLLRKVTPDPLFRFPKSSFGRHNFRPSDEMSIKNVDKDADNTTIGLICYLDA